MISVTVVKDDPLFCGRKSFEAYDAHRWIIDEIGSGLEVLATSLHGPEVIKHGDRSIYGFQFHPEKMLDETYGDELYKSFAAMYMK